MQENNPIQMYQLLMLSHGVHLRGLRFVRQQSVPVPYKGIKLGTDLRLDLLVEDKVIVDLKAKEKLSPIDKPKLLTYLRLIDKHLGLIINFSQQGRLWRTLKYCVMESIV